MREFNTFGPVNPEKHYHIDRQWVKAALHEKIDDGRYMTLTSARQTGKTTLFRELLADLEMGGEYFGILLDFELLSGFEKSDFYEELGEHLNAWRLRYQPNAPAPTPMRHQAHFRRWLQATSQTLGKKGLLIIDEFDAVSTEIIKPILSQFRGMYLEKDAPDSESLHSIILVGVRNLPSLLDGTQSPFNIADQFTVPYFNKKEVADLLTQYSDESDQLFQPDVIEGIFNETEGQPFLVNRLGKMLTEEILTDRTQTITLSHLIRALAYLSNENNTHFASITSKAVSHRDMLLPMLFYDETRANLREAATAELLMYGVLRVVERDEGSRLARIANPIYRKILLLTFAPSLEQPLDNGLIRYHHLVNGTLNFDGLLDEFKAFMIEHGVRLMQSKRTKRPLEISGQYLLLSYLTAALNGVQGYVTIESVSTAGEMDVLAFYKGKRFIVETKIWYDQTKYKEGQAQLVRYLKATGLSKGYLVIFDEHLDSNPLLVQNRDVFELTVDGKMLRIYLIGVTV